VPVPAPQPTTTPAAAPAAQPVFATPTVAVNETPAEALSDTQSAEPTVYVLRAGDNLTHLSAQYGTSIEAILSANGLTNANRIYVGQSLLVPTASTPPVSEVAQTVEPPVADTPDQTTAATTSYKVQPGDSATSIARQFGVDLDALLAENGVANRNRVYVGQVLTIP
jgi:LysM repeat protein